MVDELVQAQNKRTVLPSCRRPIQFVPTFVKRHALVYSAAFSGVLAHATDWQCLFDYDDSPTIFPPSIYATDLRPDVVIWSDATKTVILLELTIPYEDNIADAEFRKKAKYQDLAGSCRLAGWDVYLQSIEVGVRGFVAGSFRKSLKLLGASNASIKRATSRASRTALRCSYSLYLARNLGDWKPLKLIYDSSI